MAEILDYKTKGKEKNLEVNLVATSGEHPKVVDQPISFIFITKNHFICSSFLPFQPSLEGEKTREENFIPSLGFSSFV